MKRFFKYGVVPIITFLFLLIVTVLVLPVLVNVQKYVPKIEKRISEATGRPISIGPDLGLSFFPWLCVSFSDMKFGNPQGFLSDEFIKIESFETRIKLLPLLKKELQISRFVVGGLEINLEKREDGKVNWDFGQEKNNGIPAAPSLQPGDWSLPDGFSIALLAVTNGVVNWSDRMQQSRHKIDDLMLLLNNVTVDDPIGVDFKASIDGKQLAVEGKIASIGEKPGLDPLTVDVEVAFLNTLKGQVKGQIANLRTNPGYDLALQLSPFSPRDFFAALKLPFPVESSDPTVFSSLELDILAKGSREQFSIEKGRAKLDDTHLDFSLVVVDFARPDLGFSLNIDSLDLDRYRAPETDEKDDQDQGLQGEQVGSDYSSLRDMILAGALQLGQLRVGGGTVNNVNVQMRAADGIFAVGPSSFSLYQGHAQSTMAINFQGETPKVNVDLQAEGVQVGPLLHDFVGTDFLSGLVNTNVVLQFSGDSNVTMKKSLNGEGVLLFRDGALAGIDLARTVRGLEKALAGSDSPDQRPRTDFSELKSDITIKNGLIESKETTLMSPFIRLLVTGTADLVTEQLNLKFEPKGVTTTQRQGDEEKRSGSAVPLTISGSFTDLIMNIDGAKISVDEQKMSPSVAVHGLAEKELPSPLDADVKNLVGRALIDPAIAAQRFGLQPETIRKSQVKKQHSLGSGKIRIRPLQEEATLY